MFAARSACRVEVNEHSRICRAVVAVNDDESAVLTANPLRACERTLADCHYQFVLSEIDLVEFVATVESVRSNVSDVAGNKRARCRFIDKAIIHFAYYDRLVFYDVVSAVCAEHKRSVKRVLSYVRKFGLFADLDFCKSSEICKRAVFDARRFVAERNRFKIYCVCKRAVRNRGDACKLLIERCDLIGGKSESIFFRVVLRHAEIQIRGKTHFAVCTRLTDVFIQNVSDDDKLLATVIAIIIIFVFRSVEQFLTDALDIYRRGQNDLFEMRSVCKCVFSDFLKFRCAAKIEFGESLEVHTRIRCDFRDSASFTVKNEFFGDNEFAQRFVCDFFYAE